ncbi:hypothetical protein RHMOL_Rhmol05G0090100 [Rhododendron molle]|uniref:Uncharacterized protein n=1 Tax=Rhododendron molle TaxID=49168 RepID=A0ACC0NN68_RHOML|nr:hypothetical protein RHMOL_Rhmol05G0090100 [Rhododendron molle]
MLGIGPLSLFGLTIGIWHPLGPLYKKYGEQVCANIGRSLHARVSSISRKGAWFWPRERNTYIQEIKLNTPLDLLPDISKEDSVIWTPSLNGNYSLKSAWNAIRVSHGIQDWCKVVWFPKAVPRWAFILWMAMQCKLASKDILLGWSVVDNANCVLCRKSGMILLNLTVTHFLNALILGLSGWRYYGGIKFIEAPLIGKKRGHVQDERELKRQRRKQSNRESARRSRLRKQTECDELALRTEALNEENTTLRTELSCIRSEYEQLVSENASLKVRRDLGRLLGKKILGLVGISIQLAYGYTSRALQSGNEIPAF